MNHIQIIGPLQICYSDPLGSGSTGNVYKGKFNITHTSTSQYQNLTHSAAIKVISQWQRYQNQVTQYLYLSQKLALSTLNHPYIIKCYGIFQDHSNSYLATQFIKGGTIREYLDMNGKMNQRTALEIFKKLLQGLKHISANKFVHRDLKPSNIMLKQQIQDLAENYQINSSFQSVTSTISPIIIDFGYCQKQTYYPKPSMYYNVGSSSYMSPQSYNHNKYSQKSDLWSLGVILYEMLTGETLDLGYKIEWYFANTQQAIQQKLLQKRLYLPMKSRKILKFLLVENELERPSIDQLIQFVKNMQNRFQLNFINFSKKPNSLKQKESQKVSINNFQNPQNNSFQNKQQKLQDKKTFFQLRKLKSQGRLRIPSFLQKNNSKLSNQNKMVSELVDENSIVQKCMKQILPQDDAKIRNQNNIKVSPLQIQYVQMKNALQSIHQNLPSNIKPMIVENQFISNSYSQNNKLKKTKSVQNLISPQISIPVITESIQTKNSVQFSFLESQYLGQAENNEWIRPKSYTRIINTSHNINPHINLKIQNINSRHEHTMFARPNQFKDSLFPTKDNFNSSNFYMQTQTNAFNNKVQFKYSRPQTSFQLSSQQFFNFDSLQNKKNEFSSPFKLQNHKNYFKDRKVNFCVTAKN